VVQRRLLHRDRVLRTGYIEGVAVRADRRGRGYGAAVMEPLERIVRGAYDVGALGSSETATGFYAGRGWKAWRGQAWALTPTGRIRTAEEEGFIFVFDGPNLLDLDGEVTCDWREGDLW
jgi:aminoglycoside 2'-N-acetyltransferase I